MSTTDSQALPTNRTTSLEREEKAALEGFELAEGIRRLGRMAGVKSISRNLRNEDRAAERDIDIHQRALWSESVANGAEESSSEEMEIMAARDVHIHHQQPQAAAVQGAIGSALPIAAAATASPIWPALAIGASMLAGGLGVGYGMAKTPPATQSTQPAVQDSREYSLGLIPAGGK